jgi:8-oxo-dGTP pyrophosphatase MutT (NUDIX family)
MLKQHFEYQINKLTATIAKGLPGTVAHTGMAPAHRNRLINNSKGPEFARKSSVLILLFPDEQGEINTAFIKRVEYDGVHSGQVAFPGGQFEKTDIDLTATALREAEEEVGVKATSVTVIGKLSDLFVPPSNFIISPVLAKCLFRPEFIPDGKEVAEVFTVPLKHFLNPQFKGEYEIPYRNGEMIRIPGYYFKNFLIWGATAMILNELLQLAKDAGIMNNG